MIDRYGYGRLAMSLSIEPINPHFGARVTGVSIRDGMDDATFARIERAFEDHSVLVFRGQPVTDEQQIAFSERFGPLEGTIAGVVGTGSKVVRVSNMLPDGTLKTYPGLSHGLFATHPDIINADMLAFISS